MQYMLRMVSIDKWGQLEAALLDSQHAYNANLKYEYQDYHRPAALLMTAFEWQLGPSVVMKSIDRSSTLHV